MLESIFRAVYTSMFEMTQNTVPFTLNCKEGNIANGARAHASTEDTTQAT